jgi:predicted amidophosphoribosyltransferase
MTGRRKRRTQHRRENVALAGQHEPRLPSELETQFATVGLQLAVEELRRRRWRKAIEFAETARGHDPTGAAAVIAEASSREARRCALTGEFAAAERWASRALELRPANPDYQERRRLISEAKRMVLRDWETPLFPDSIGPSGGRWWEVDLFGRVRGWDGSKETVPAPLILHDVKRAALEDIYAVGIYRPWHAGGPTPLFTQYIKQLKPGGRTIPLASILLRQGLILETDWIEEIDVMVPMATSLRSFETRGFELTEELGRDLASRLCIPFLDVFERSAESGPTHAMGGYGERHRQLTQTLRLKHAHSALLTAAEAVLVIDDVVTYGSTFEACASKLHAAYPSVRVYGAALAYTETDQRRERAEEERRGNPPTRLEPDG